MKHGYLLFFLFAIQSRWALPLSAQDTAKGTMKILRIYEDNDFINVYGKGSDDAYTAGTRIDFFYEQKKRSHFIIDRLMPRAGDSSVNTAGWGIMQLIFTPNDLSTPYYQPDDYAYSGSLFIVRSLYSFNPVKKLAFKTELMAGMRGPASLAEETQILIHKIINYERPMGWEHQLPSRVLFNGIFTAEKQIASAGNRMEIIGGGQLFVGNTVNGASIYPLIRIGKMAPYFNGFINQYHSNSNNKLQAYLVIKPSVTFELDNALQEGRVPNKDPEKNEATLLPVPVNMASRKVNRMLYSVDAGAVVAYGRWSVSFNQIASTAMVRGLYSHDTGNISVYVIL